MDDATQQQRRRRRAPRPDRIQQHQQRLLRRPPPPDIQIVSRIGEGVYGVVYHAVHRGAGDKPVAVKRNVASAGTHGMTSLREADALARIAAAGAARSGAAAAPAAAAPATAPPAHPFLVHYLGAVADGEIAFPDAIASSSAAPAAEDDDASVADGAAAASDDDDDAGFDDDAVNDRVHFVMALEATNLQRATRREKPLPPATTAAVAVQLLLALEWLHARGFVHRDLKPGNVLFNGSTTAPQVRICDFGLFGAVSSGARMDSPGLVTSWYRAPEIALGAHYDATVDTWALAMVLIELATGVPVMSSSEDLAVSLVATMCSALPNLATFSMIESAGTLTLRELAGVRSRLTPAALAVMLSPESAHATAEQRHEALRGDVAALLGCGSGGRSRGAAAAATEQQQQQRVLFCDLLARMLAFDPAARASASAALEHPFFSSASAPAAAATMSTVRAEHPPSPPPLPAVALFHTAERAVAYALLVQIYNRSVRLPWFDGLSAIHGMDLFDRYVAHEVASSPAALDAAAPPDETVWLRMYTCLYAFHKYFATLTTPHDWADFVPPSMRTPAARAESERFEAHVVGVVCGYAIFRDTLAEVYMSQIGRLTNRATRDAIRHLGNLPAARGSGSGGVPRWTGGSIRALARHFGVGGAAAVSSLAASPPRRARSPTPPPADSAAAAAAAVPPRRARR